MRRGFLTFLLVLAFFPVALHSQGMHSLAVGRVQETGAFLMEQQAVSNAENNFESSFWKVMEYGAAKGMGEQEIAMELEALRSMLGHKVWAAMIGPDYYNYVEPPEDEGIENFIEVNPYGTVEVKYSGLKKSRDKRAAIGTNVEIGGTSSVYIIPGGRSHEFYP